MSSYYERIKEAAQSSWENATALLWWLFARSPKPVSAVGAINEAALPRVTKSTSFLRWLLTKSPRLLRRGVQGVVIYALSYVAKDTLDIAHEEYPDNGFVAKADTVANAAVKAENFLLTGATSIAKDIYDSIPAQAAPSKASIPTAALPSELTKAIDESYKTATENPNAAITIPQVSAEQLLPPPGMPISLTPPIINQPIREAAFMPIKSGQRNRSNLNAALMPPISPEPVIPALAPDGLPIDGGYDPVTEITWGPYGRPIEKRIISNRAALPLADR